jgi:hypothetical protein
VVLFTVVEVALMIVLLFVIGAGRTMLSPPVVLVGVVPVVFVAVVVVCGKTNMNKRAITTRATMPTIQAAALLFEFGVLMISVIGYADWLR